MAETPQTERDQQGYPKQSYSLLSPLMSMDLQECDPAQDDTANQKVFIQVLCMRKSDQSAKAKQQAEFMLDCSLITASCDV